MTILYNRLYVDTFINYQHLSLGCPAIHNSVFRSELFKGVVIYNIFTFVDTMGGKTCRVMPQKLSLLNVFHFSKTVQHVTYCKFGVWVRFVRPRYGF